MTQNTNDSRRHDPHIHGAFGLDVFGQRAESFARFFGTPKFLIGQTALVALWIAFNVLAVSLQWDPYPFILLNLAFSLQAAYAAPLILLAQTRQADRERVLSASDTEHREALARASTERQDLALHETLVLKELIEVNTRLTEKVNELTSEIHRRLVTQ